MGLDAVVYRNASKYKWDPRAHKLDARTGEVYGEGGPDLPRAVTEALHERLGNAAAIREIASEIKRIAKLDAIHRLVLYSGTHAGDVIGLKDVSTLKRELDLLKTEHPKSEAVREFVRQMYRLIRAAEREQNPIVFT